MTMYTSYDTVGIKEDVSDVISNIAPTKTPFQTLIGSEKTTSRRFDWLEDSLAAPRDNAQVEGFDAVTQTLSPPTLRNNVTQILEKSYRVSATEDAVDQYGRAKETAYQTVKAMKELKRDFERAMIGVDQVAVAGNNATARRMASATQQVDDSVTTTLGTAAAFNETHLLTIAQQGFTEGAEPTYLMVKPADALKVANFAAAAGRERDFGSDRKIVNVVDLYVSPFGEYKVVLNRFMLNTVAWLLDPEMWSKVTLRNWTREPLAKNGDSERNMIVGEMSLKNKNFRSSPVVRNLTTT